MRFTNILKTLMFMVMALTTTTTYAQPTDEELDKAMSQASFREKWEVANELFSEKFYHQSLRVWKRMLEEDAENANILYHIGRCYLNSNTEKTKALPYLEQVTDKISNRWSPFTHTESNAPVDAYFYLGKAYHLNYDFDKAIESFQKFKAEAHKKHILQHQAGVEIVMCQNGKKLVENKRNWIITNVGEVINSEYSDFSPVLSIDGSVMYFTSRRLRADSSNELDINPQDGKYYEDIYITYRDDKGNWSEPDLLEDFCYEDRNEATINTSADGQTLFVYIDDDGDGNIYTTQLLDTVYSDLKKLGGEINTTSWETHATVTPDGNTMYFVSDRKGGLGGRDIYRIKKLPNGEWSKPYNLGAPINTEDDEDSPFIAADGLTMYYSSNGPESMGGFDIFVTKLNEETQQWSDPKNMGYPLNTVDDDVFFVVTADGKTGYYSSVHNLLEEDKGGDWHGEKDIYAITFDTAQVFNVAILKGTIQTSDGSPLPASIEILVYNLTDGSGPKPYKPRLRDGSYVLDLKPCNEYRVEYLLASDVFYETDFQVPCSATYQVLHNEIFLNPLTLQGDGGMVKPKDSDTTDQQTISEDEIVLWKVVSTPVSLADGKVEPVDLSGQPMSMVTISDNGKFEYKRLPDQKEYVFTLKLDDPQMCPEICIALINEKDEVIGFAKRESNCKFVYRIFEKRWQVLYQDEPYDAAGTKVTYLDENGNISFNEELGCDGIFEYKQLEAGRQPIFMINSDDPGLCEEMKVVLVDANGNQIGETIRDAKCRFIYKRDEVVTTGDCPEKSSYERFYTYNKKGIAQDEANFNKMLDDIEKIVECRGKVMVEIEASASKVPTSTYGTNENLSRQRASSAKERLLNALKARGIDSSKIVIQAVNARVLGPDYNNDYLTNRAEYEKYQYIKIFVK